MKVTTWMIAGLLAMSSACMHHVSGTTADSFGRVQVGKASWYGARFDGRKTASGERFDRHRMTAAHRTLPFGTRVRVTHQGNGRSVVVRINDRGPYGAGRIIDLSEAAARSLRMTNQGVALVAVEVLPPASR